MKYLGYIENKRVHLLDKPPRPITSSSWRTIIRKAGTPTIDRNVTLYPSGLMLVERNGMTEVFKGATPDDALLRAGMTAGGKRHNLPITLEAHITPEGRCCTPSMSSNVNLPPPILPRHRHAQFLQRAAARIAPHATESSEWRQAGKRVLLATSPHDHAAILRDGPAAWVYRIHSTTPRALIEHAIQQRLIPEN